MAPGGRDVRLLPRVGLVHRPIGFGADAVGIGDDAPERRPQRGTEPRREDVHALRLRHWLVDGIGRGACKTSKRSEQSTTALQSLMCTSYAVFCFNTKIQSSIT